MKSNLTMEKRDSRRYCRIAIVGAHRVRVAKVMSLLLDEEEPSTCLQLPPPVTEAEGTTDKQSHASLEDKSEDLDACVDGQTIAVEYLPCVATFDSYENEIGESVRYLAKLEYHGRDGKQARGTSIAPFFEVDDEDGDIIGNSSGILAFVVGCGIESPRDISMIERFVQSLSGDIGGDKLGNGKRSTVIHCVQPNIEYSSMKEENEAYKALDEDEKAEVTRLQTLGPGKMAKFVRSVAAMAVKAFLVHSRVGTITPANEKPREESAVETGKYEPEEAAQSENASQNALDIIRLSPLPEVPDPDKIRFACKRCRTILFGEDDLEDPPHAIARHNFSRRKNKASGNDVKECASAFLAGGLEWMGDISEIEGRINCPKCSSKLGSWRWPGAQCSCGTWVTPALQIHLSRVDVIEPFWGSGADPALVVPESGIVGPAS